MTIRLYYLNFFTTMQLSKNSIVKTHSNASLQNLGGGERVRTDDPLRARQVLSQLSYTPNKGWWAWLDSNQRPHDYQSCALAN